MIKTKSIKEESYKSDDLDLDLDEADDETIKRIFKKVMLAML